MFTFKVCYTKVISQIKILFLLTAVLLPTAKTFGEEKNIFFLHTYSDQFPWRAQFNTAIREGLKERRDWNYYSETMDTLRLGESMSTDNWRQYIARKYSEIEFDAVLADSIHASVFIDTYGEELFGDVPKVIFTHREQAEKPLTCYFNNEQDEAVLKTFQLAVRDNPKRKKFVIVEYNSPLYTKHKSAIDKIADENGISVSVLNNFTLSELQDSIRKLKGDEIIFYFLVRTDNTGEVFVPRDVINKIIEVSPAPVYTFWSTLIGTGIVGGVMVDGYTSALEMFRALDDYFTDGRFRDDYTTQSTFIDWDKAKTFG
ncbi:MAG: hypothetical protein PQJ50_10895, partial [Spirochaetales bacterium]|nr:hypothetical protein [Spirochaetales bacterium]